MSTRTRTSGRSYTARLQQRTGDRRRAEVTRARVSTGWLPASLAVGVEVNQLLATLVEWPGSAARGVVHVVVAALFGLFAATAYFRPTRALYGAGVGLGLLVPVGWLGSAFGAAPFVDYPVAAAVGGTVVAVALVGLLGWRLTRMPG